MSDSCLVVTYHYVRVTEDTIFPTLKALAPNDFERQLDVLGKAHNFIDCAELEAAIVEGGARGGASLEAGRGNERDAGGQSNRIRTGNPELQ